MRSGGRSGSTRLLPFLSSVLTRPQRPRRRRRAQRPEAHPPARQSRLPLPSERHRSAPASPGRGGWEGEPRLAEDASRGERREGRRAVARRLTSSARAAPLPPLSLWSEARAPHRASETASWAPDAAAAAASVRPASIGDPAPVRWLPPRPPPSPGPAGAAATAPLPPHLPGRQPRLHTPEPEPDPEPAAGKQGGGYLGPGPGSSFPVRGRRGGIGASVWSWGAGEGPPRCRKGVPAAATHAGAGSGGGAERSRPGPPPRGRRGHPPGALASRPGVYDPGPQVQQSPPAGGRGPRCEAAAGAAGRAGPALQSFPSLPPALNPLGGLLPGPVAGPPAPRQDSGRSS